MKHFLIDKNYGSYLSAMGFSVEEVLKKAVLPEDLFARQAPSLTAEEYFRFMQAVDTLSPDDETPIQLAASDNIETFSPPIFAAYAAFIGTDIVTADRNQLTFSKTDALIPFISCNESMWSFFEPKLNRRLSMMDTDDSYAARVRSA